MTMRQPIHEKDMMTSDSACSSLSLKMFSDVAPVTFMTSTCEESKGGFKSHTGMCGQFCGVPDVTPDFNPALLWQGSTDRRPSVQVPS